MDGIRDMFGLWAGENQSAKFWLSILNDLKNGSFMIASLLEQPKCL
ncbi:transposase [Sporomusa paucivorans]